MPRGGAPHTNATLERVLPEDALPLTLEKPPRRLPASLAADSPTPIVIGLLLCAAGFGLIAYCWSQVALRMSVADQVPYIVSAGFTGLGLIIVGALAVSIQVRRRDAELQLRRLEQLVANFAGPVVVSGAGRPVGVALGAALAMVVAGFVTILWAAGRAAGSDSATVQVPYAVSGGLLGLALVAAGSLLAHVLVSRSTAQRRDAAVADVIASCADVHRAQVAAIRPHLHDGRLAES